MAPHGRKRTERERALSPRIVDSAFEKPRAGLTGDEAIERMADDFRYAKTRLGNVTESDMSLLGWKKSQLTEFGAAAREAAYTLEGAH